MRFLKKISSALTRYKLHHLLFWLVYHYFWWAWTSGSAIAAANNILFSPYTIKFASYVIFQALGVYFNLYFLIPRFLQKGKYLMYGLSLLLTVLGTAALIIGGYYLNAYATNLTFEELFQRSPDEYWELFKANAFPSTAASMTLAMSIKLAKVWLKSEKHRNEVEKEKLQTELKFLRSQLNPHFLFNTINSIFVLIHKNQDMASESLAKFSELLRYQLYECNEPFILLDKELEYLKNFIELEKLRHDRYQLQSDIVVDQGIAGSFSIAPFLLLPFVENAFKHISCRSDQPNWIRLSLRVEKENLVFTLSNSIQPMHINDQEEDSSGVGLKNVQRRLELLYPEAHTLEIDQSENAYKVRLQIKLSGTSSLNLKTA